MSQNNPKKMRRKIVPVNNLYIPELSRRIAAMRRELDKATCYEESSCLSDEAFEAASTVEKILKALEPISGCEETIGDINMLLSDALSQFNDICEQASNLYPYVDEDYRHDSQFD